MATQQKATVTSTALDRVDEQRKVFETVEGLNDRMTGSLLEMVGQSVNKISEAMTTAVTSVRTAFAVASLKYRTEALEQVLGQIEAQRGEIDDKLKTAKGKALKALYEKRLKELDAQEDAALRTLGGVGVDGASPPTDKLLGN